MIILPAREVVLESPYKATDAYSVEQHMCYLSHCITDCGERGEIPYCSHFGLIGTDDDDFKRQVGIRRGWQWGDKAEYVVAYTDFGVTEGMSLSIAHYEKLGKPIEWRKLPASIVKSILEMAG